MKDIQILDSTLRDGAQAEGISFTLHDKLDIVRRLDQQSVAYIEAGNPFSNPKDMEFFSIADRLALENAKLVAFGSTRRRELRAEEDPGLRALLQANTDTVAIFGKSSVMQVTEVLNTSLENNLQMILDTVYFLKQQGKTVFFDAEHFFDGYKGSAEYALSCLEAAQTGGADLLVLCDTNGGCFPDEAARITAEVCSVTATPIGIHCHNDIGCAVANSLMAVEAGAVQVQGTFLGFGERCGNTNLSSLIPSLQLKRGYRCIREECMENLTKTARYIAEVANITLDNSLPYVGSSAFSHKGGMHVDGVRKNPSSFEHIAPESVGNKRNILVSEVSGRAALLSMIREVDSSITKDSPEAQLLTDSLKALEKEGFLFESAAASLELLITKKLGRFHPFFQLERFKVIGEQEAGADSGLSSALIKIKVGEQSEITAAEGDGPVHALDLALKKAVSHFYPKVLRLRLTDYKVRVIESSDATAAVVRVLITTTNGEEIWTTIGVSRDIVEASLHALMDSIEYRLMKSSS